jgi:hypothetical protein
MGIWTQISLCFVHYTVYSLALMKIRTIFAGWIFEIWCIHETTIRTLNPVLWIRITLMQIRMLIRIPLFTQMRIRILAVKKGSNPWKSAKISSYSIHFGLTSANRCGSGPGCGFGSTTLLKPTKTWGLHEEERFLGTELQCAVWRGLAHVLKMLAAPPETRLVGKPVGFQTN